MTTGNGSEEPNSEPRHVDDWIDDSLTSEADEVRYAAKWLALFRRPAIDKIREPNEAKLFATYGGCRYRVTGCSRLGDVWITPDFSQNEGYKRRVDVTTLSNWGAER